MTLGHSLRDGTSEGGEWPWTTLWEMAHWWTLEWGRWPGPTVKGISLLASQHVLHDWMWTPGGTVGSLCGCFTTILSHAVTSTCLHSVGGFTTLHTQNHFSSLLAIQSPPKESIHFCRAEYSKLRRARWKVWPIPYFSCSLPWFWVLAFAASVYFLSVETVKSKAFITFINIIEWNRPQWPVF